MPHIKHIRLVNVHFNNATQFYDDFNMELKGWNTTYDLENGGGKSLLLMMVLQTVLPKSYLRKEKPISLIFQGGKDRTSHAAVEWILDEGSSYKYLLTGFCARKRRSSGDQAKNDISEEEKSLQATDIEHLNWCIFYNDNKITGIKSAPFVVDETGKKTYAGFEDVRKYIQQMKQKGLPAEVFDKIEKYQSYISAHNLLSAEWNIIRGINSGENNIETYFRQNATSRKLIENQFVKIVEDVEALGKGEKSNDESFLLADTLIEIRDRLNEYQRLKGHMNEYEKIKEYYDEFGERNTELFHAFSAFETSKQQAVAIWNLIKNKIGTLLTKQQAVIARRDDLSVRSNEGMRTKRLLEAGLVNYERERLSASERQLEVKREQFIEQQTRLTGLFNQLMTLEGYGEYRTTKGKLHEIQKRLQVLEDNGDRFISDYRSAGGKLKFLTERQITAFELLWNQSEAAKVELEAKRKHTQQELYANAGKEAVLNNEISKLKENERDLEEALAELSGFFLKRNEMDAVLFPDQFLGQTETDLDRHLSESEAKTDKIKTIDNQIHGLELDLEKTGGQIERQLDRKKSHTSWLDAYQMELGELEQKAFALGFGTLPEYQDGMELLLRKENLRKLEEEIRAGRLRQKMQLSEEHGYYVPNEELLSLAEQLSSKCQFVKTGIEWIAEEKPEERDSILQRFPFLPFAVIVDRKSFEKLSDGRTKLDFSTDYLVPIVNLETVRSVDPSEKERIYYFCSFADMLIDRNQYEQYIEHMGTILGGIENDIADMGNRLEDLNGDLTKVSAFYVKYPSDQVEHKRIEVESTAHDIANLEKRIHDANREKGQLVAEKDALDKWELEQNGLIEECRLKIAKLSKTIQYKKELAMIREQSGENRKELMLVNNKLAQLNAAVEEFDQQFHQLNEQMNQLTIKLHDLRNEKEQLLSFEEMTTELPIDRVRADYRAFSDAVSGKMDEENNLRSRLNEYGTNLKTLKDRILRDYGRDLDEIDRIEARNQMLIIPTRADIETAKLDIEVNNKNISTVGDEITDINSRIQKTMGRLEEILKDFPENAVRDLPCYEDDFRYHMELEAVKQLIDSYDEGVQKADNELEKIKDDHEKLQRQAEDYEAFIVRENVTDDGAIASEPKDYRQFEKEYNQLQVDIKRQFEKWDDRIKTIKAETATFIISEPVEQLDRIGKPTGAARCLARQDDFAEYIANIEEQMQKIGEDIVRLESYQKDFTRRCIQRAELVLGHLRKLDSLSRIEVYGRRTSMIELKLQEFEDKEKQLRMKTHINGIIQEISENGAIDRKRVAVKLSTKELLAQIANMEKAVVKLYKVESIPENSKSYSWEEAIGSDGQNNSLYFIFAACLISYIRMLSVTHTSIRTKKVIIADNPFGATSAVYLWDPMFKIMKQNDIQLIAPGHRIPREITSRFGVSYLLNQDILQDNRMRVVVKDVRVEEDEMVLRYGEPEQLSLF